MKVVAIIQARMGSTRLPGKVMRSLGKHTVLGWVIRRVAACVGVDQVVVATTAAAEDDLIAAEAERHGAGVFRGSEANVLSRYTGAARMSGATTVVRVTSDCPFFDPLVLTAMLQRFALGGVDYLSNTWGRRTWPRGLDAEVFSRAVLEQCEREAREPYEFEHVTPYIYTHPERFALAGYESPVDHSDHRWTLDTPEDWALIEQVHQALEAGDRLYRTEEILNWLQAHPEVFALNAQVQQKRLGE